jgi:hypothetical protein
MMIQTIRIGRKSLSFAVTDPTNTTQPITYVPYVVKSGISMSANLREAFKTTDIPRTPKVQVMVDSKILLVPVERFVESQVAELYRHSYPKSELDSIEYNVLPDANAVALFSINKDLKMVLTDRFEDVKLIHLMSPVWRYLHQRSFTGHRNKLFGYFHDQQLEIFSFQQHRFKFCNSFDTAEMHDALYFLLYVWKQLNLQPEHDEMHLVGDIPEQNMMLEELHNYLHHAYIINPSVEFNKTPATQIKGMPFDLMALLTKGR